MRICVEFRNTVNSKLLTGIIQKPQDTVYRALGLMELRGIEPLSEASSIKTSSTTVYVLTFPHSYGRPLTGCSLQ